MLNTLQNIILANKALSYSTFFLLLLFVILAVIAPFESREVLGINLWIKPIKFSLSIAIFLLTSIYILNALPYSQTKLSIVSWVLVASMFIEITAIVFQASRGQLSHFNITDPIGSILFPLMGIAILIAYLVYAMILYDYFTLPTNLSPELLWAIRLGIIIFLFGGISGFMMASGLKHTVGLADGGPGLPFTNWSTVAGDLRVSHFISLHAIQLLPLLAIALQNVKSLPIRNVTLVVLVGGIYFLFAIMTLIQAMYGKPFIKLPIS